MQVKAVHAVRRARYPTQAELESSELRQSMPARWSGNPKIVAFVAIAGATMQAGWASEHAVTPGMYPPRYMTESNAVDIAKELSTKAGLSFKLNSKKIPITITTKGGKTKKVDFVLDLYDSKSGVGFECLSLFDCYDVYGYDSKVTPQELAKTINKSLSKDDRTKIKVVAEAGRASKLGREKEEEELRTNLKAFFDWLKKQGVI